MNKIVSKLYIALLATLVTLLSACTPETYELGSQDIVSDDLAEGIGVRMRKLSCRCRLRESIA